MVEAVRVLNWPKLPSNLALRRVGTANWLSFIAFSWGTVMLGQGFVKNFQALAVCRTLLGFFEAGEFLELDVSTLRASTDL